MSFIYRKDVLDDGLTVVTESNSDAGSIALGFWIGVGARFEPRTLAGVSHFIEHILFKGTDKRSAYEIAHALESVGGSIDAFAGREATAFVSRCLPEHLRRAVDVTTDMLSRPAMKEEAIEVEKKVITEEIRNFLDTPEEIVHEHLARSVWGSSPMGNPILGSIESVSQFDRGSILPYFRRHYVSANMIVAATGKVNHRMLTDYVEAMLKTDEARPEVAVEAQGGLPKLYHDRREVSQCYICMGTEGVAYLDKRRYPMILLSMLIGGGMTSRLFQEVRERQGLAYSIYCSCEFYRQTGIFFIHLAVDPKKARKAVRMVSREIERFKADGPRRGELMSVKQQLRGSLILGLESTSARMGRLAKQEFHTGGYEPVEKSVATASRVTTDRVMSEAERVFDPSRFSLVVVGPPSTDFPTHADLHF